MPQTGGSGGNQMWQNESRVSRRVTRKKDTGSICQFREEEWEEEEGEVKVK